MSIWDKDALRRKLLSPVEEETLLRTYGEVLRPILEKVLDERVEELADRYQKAWGGFFAHMRDEHDGIPMVSRSKAAELLGVSLSTIQRLEERGELPQPEHFGARTVRHRLEDIVAFARGKV
jgi:excisionase family DNA binding protein